MFGSQAPRSALPLPLLQAQELSLNYHCKCEQWVHFGTGSFFNFNGTAGVWRRKCIEAIGGWNSRTTVRHTRSFVSWPCYLLDYCLQRVTCSWAALVACGCTLWMHFRDAS